MNQAGATYPCRASGPDAGPCANCYLLGRRCKGGAHNRDGKPPPKKLPWFDVHRAAEVIAYMIVLVCVFFVAAALCLGVITWLKVKS